MSQCRTSSRIMVTLAMFALGFVLATTGRAFPPEDKGAAEFELKDQFNKTYSFRFPRENLSVLIFGDRRGSDQVEGWAVPLDERFGGKIEILGIAELSGVPSAARPVVRRVMRSRVKEPVLLDWKGEVSRNYGYAGGKALLVVADRRGRVIYRTEGGANANDLENVSRAIKNAL